MKTPWTFIRWNDLYEEHKYFVQSTLRDERETHRIMNYIVYAVSCEAARRIEEHCLSGLKQIIDEFKEKNAGKEPEDCNWLDFIFHYSRPEQIQKRILQDDFLKKDICTMLEDTAGMVSKTIIKEYNLLINSRTKASMG